MKKVHAGETIETKMAGRRCGLFRSGMDAACNAVNMDISKEEYDMHSRGITVLIIGRGMPKGYLGVVFVFQ